MTNPNRYYSSSALATTLSATVSSALATTITVPTSPTALNWPSSFPYQLVLDAGTIKSEIVLVTGVSGTGPYTLTVTRGVDGTTATTHAQTSAPNVVHAVSGHDFGEYQAHAAATGPTTYGPDSNPVQVHGIQGGSVVVGTTDSQTLTNKSLTSPALTGSPTAPTQSALDSSTKLATTSYTDSAVGVENSRATTAEALLAPLASPALTGNPTAPTKTALDNSTKLATTAYTDAAAAVVKAASVPLLNASPSTATGAVFDGSTDDHTALINAQGANKTMTLPNGTSSIGATVTMNQSGVYIKGAGMFNTTLKASSAINMLLYGSSYIAQVEISDLTLDGNNVATLGMASYGSRIGRLIIRRCRFINFPGIILEGGYAANYVVEDCVAEGSGAGVATFFYSPNQPFESLTIRRNKMRYLYQGVVLGSTGFHAAFVDISDNEIDGGWYLLASQYSGSGGNVTYTSTGLTDTGASFGTIPHVSPSQIYVRALNPRVTSSFTAVNGTYLTDTNSNFVTAGVKRGEIIRTGTSFAVVSNVIDATHLHVEEWLSQTTYQPVAPPANTAAYTEYQVILGCINGSTSTTISVQHGASGGGGGWFDLSGASVTPPSGCLYEVLAAAGGYQGVFCNTTTDKLVISRNRIRRSRYDGLELFGSKMVVTDNIVQDGQDEGLVIQGASSGSPNTSVIVQGNILDHNGTSGLFVGDCTDIEIGHNQYRNNCWCTPTTNNDGQISLYQATNVTVMGGRATVSSESTPTVGMNIQDVVTSGIKVIGFTGSGHTLGDVYIRNDVPAAAVDLLDIDGVITYQSGAAGQRLRIKGTGTPTIAAATGSVFIQTDATVNNPEWVYYNGAWNQGLGAGGTITGSLTVGGSVTAYGGYASASLTTPTGLTVTPTGTTGATSYAYKVAAVAGNSSTSPTSEVLITNGNATLSGTNYNAVSWTGVPNALGYAVYGRIHNVESLLAVVTGTSYNDTGAATPAAARNLLTATIVTPSFITNSTGWALSTGATIARDATTGPNANGTSLKVITGGSSGSGTQSSTTGGPACSPATQYVMSFYAKGAGTTLRANFLSHPADVAFVANTNIVLTNTWTRYSITGTTPAGATSLWAAFQVLAVVNTFWISCIQMELGSTPTTYIDTTANVATPATGAQFLINSWPGQNSPPMIVSDSTNATLFQVDSSGNVTAAGNYVGPAMTGVPTAPTATALTSNTQVATTAYADAAVTVETSRATTAEALLAPLASPALTGNPTAPTQTALTNNTRVASTAYADAAVAVENSRATTAEALLAPLASPALTGNPTVPTQTALTNNTRAASTAYADAAVAVENSRATTAEALLAPLASPALTGNPTVPTQAVGNNTTRAASTAFVTTAVNNSGLVLPQDLGVMGWTQNPAYSSSTYLLTGAGKLLLWTFKVPVAGNINTINYAVFTVGNTLANAFIGVYSMGGTLLGSCTTDQSTNMTGSTGGKIASLSSALAVTPGLYRVGLVIGSATTMPTLTATSVSNNALFTSIGLTAANLMSGSISSGLTALPGSYTPASVAPLATLPVFVMT